MPDPTKPEPGLEGPMIDPTTGDFVPVKSIAKFATKAMMAAKPGLAAIPFAGVTAFHGSPHKFDKFRMDKIGTGEGAQTYGHGLYFAENPKVAEEYRKALSLNLSGEKLDDIVYTWKRSGVDIGATRSKDGQITIHKLLVPNNKRNQGIGTAAMENLINYADETGQTIKLSPSTDFGGTSVGRLKEFYKRFGFIENKGRNKDFTISDSMYRRPVNQGATYKVDISDDAVKNFLDWDKPLSQQPESVRKALTKWTKDKGGSILDGESALKEISFDLRMRGMDDSPAAVSAELKKLGIPGIRYLDQGSRTAGKGTHNYVVFDEDIVKILGRE